MKIIITKTFLKDYEKILKKDNLFFVIEKIKQKLSNKLIYLKRPFVKIKFNIKNISIRLVWKYIEDRFLLFPIFIYKKTNKKDWFNITWEKTENKILDRMKKINLDLEKWDYEVFK